MNASIVEEWLDTNQEFMHDYFMRRADIILINKWLLHHGFNILQDYVSQFGPRGSISQENGSPSSPLDRCSGDVFFDGKHHRSNSKKHLRQDYAKSKMRNMFRTYEPTSTQENTTEARRSSLKEMRMFRSLPPNSVNILSLLIQSRVRLPRYPSKDIDIKRELRHTNEREFFLESVKDIANDLDLKSLSSKIIANISILVDGDKGSLFVVEGRSSGRGSLVSKIFDIHSGTHILPATSGDGSIRVPWGKGIIGHVGDSGETVNLTKASQVSRSYHTSV